MELALEKATADVRADLLELRGAILMRMDLPEEALRQFESALTHRPGFERAIVGKATALSLLRRSKEALEILESLEGVTGRQPTVKILEAKATLLQAVGRTEESIVTMERALAVQPASTSLLVNYGIGLATVGRWEKALEQFEVVLGRDPKHSLSLLMKSEVLVNLGQYLEAQKTLKEMLALAPNDPGILFEKGRLLAKMGKFEEAERNILRGISLSPQAETSVQSLLDHIRHLKTAAPPRSSTS